MKYDFALSIKNDNHIVSNFILVEFLLQYTIHINSNKDISSHLFGILNLHIQYGLQ